jgi:hypothetical protein
MVVILRQSEGGSQLETCVSGLNVILFKQINFDSEVFTQSR